MAWTWASELDQLTRVIHCLRVARESGHQCGHDYEVGLRTPADELAAPMLGPGKARCMQGFPYLSLLSFSLLDGVVHRLAVYRIRDFISWANGNYPGLGRVLRLVAIRESGMAVSELTCVSASAKAEITRGGSFGHQTVTVLLDECRAALAVAL